MDLVKARVSILMVQLWAHLQPPPWNAVALSTSPIVIIIIIEALRPNFCPSQINMSQLTFNLLIPYVYPPPLVLVICIASCSTLLFLTGFVSFFISTHLNHIKWHSLSCFSTEAKSSLSKCLIINTFWVEKGPNH